MKPKNQHKIRATFTLDPDVYQKIVDLAWESRLRYSQQVELILKDYLRRIKESSNE